MTKNFVANMFLPPFHKDQLSQKEEIGVRWLIDNHHGLEWNDGFINYKLRYKIFEQHLICSSSGIEKVQWLHEFLSERHNRLVLKKSIKILNIEDKVQFCISKIIQILRRCPYTSNLSEPITYTTKKALFNNLFVLKEFATCDVTDNLVANYICLSPFHENRLSCKDEIGVRWLIDNHHGLEWNDGFINYKLRYKIFEQHLIYSSSGIEKVQWLHEFLSERHSRLVLKKSIKILNIEDKVQLCISKIIQILSIVTQKYRRCPYTSNLSKPIIYTTEKALFVDFQEFAIYNMTDNLVANYICLSPHHENRLS
ncbi:rho GTPase-activating protein gacV-like [Vespula maculifrons]|uniref:Rho GTPase-activating protein gacV-like n=1 Tax=Vespula maculifrons TaxID=7453 RepID=A0ABD2CVV3_VESMC